MLCTSRDAACTFGTRVPDRAAAAAAVRSVPEVTPGPAAGLTGQAVAVVSSSEERPCSPRTPPEERRGHATAAR